MSFFPPQIQVSTWMLTLFLGEESSPFSLTISPRLSGNVFLVNLEPMVTRRNVFLQLAEARLDERSPSMGAIITTTSVPLLLIDLFEACLQVNDRLQCGFSFDCIIVSLKLEWSSLERLLSYLKPHRV